MKRYLFRCILTMLTIGSAINQSPAFDIQGTVRDADSNPVVGAVVQLTGEAAMDITDSDGTFHLTEASAARHMARASGLSGISVRREGERLFFTVDHERNLSIDVFTLAGRYLLGRKLQLNGTVAILPLEHARSSLLIRVHDGAYTSLIQLHGFDGVTDGRLISAKDAIGASGLSAQASFSDELVITHPDFDSYSVSVSDSVGTLVLNVGYPWWKCQAEETGKAFQVLWPNGGETLYVGDTVLLKFCAWHPEEDDLTKTPPAVTNNGGISWSNLEVNNVGNRVYWAIPDSIYSVQEDKNIYLPADQCFIRISDYDNPFGHDDSDQPFAIRER